MRSTRFPSGRRFSRLLAWAGIGAILLALTIFSVRLQRLSVMREEAVHTGNRLPELRAHIRLLEARLAADTAYGSDLRASREEQAAAYVLPSSVDGSHVFRVFRDAVTALGRTEVGAPTIDSLSVEPATPEAASAMIVIRGRGTSAQFGALYGIVQWSGYLTVQDALDSSADAFLETVERAAPLSLPAIEEFLRTDLLAYAADPDAIEARIFRDMTPSLAAELKTSLLRSGLGSVRLTLTPVASFLKERRAWPLPFLSLSDLSFADGVMEMRLATERREEGNAS